jgi:glutaredoxin-like protein
MTNDANEIIFYSADWCGDCRRSKRLMDSLGVDYILIDVEADQSASERVIEINGGQRSIPVIVFKDGSHLTEPSDKDLEAKLKTLGII